MNNYYTLSTAINVRSCFELKITIFFGKKTETNYLNIYKLLQVMKTKIK